MVMELVGPPEILRYPGVYPQLLATSKTQILYTSKLLTKEPSNQTWATERLWRIAGSSK